MALNVDELIQKHTKTDTPTFTVDALIERHTPKAALSLPTPEQEALQPPGRPGLKGAVQNFFDPGVLLDPFNLAAGAGAGLKTGVGVLRGIGQAASGLYGPLVGFGRGFVKGLREPFPQPTPKPAASPPKPEPTGSYSSETGTRSAMHRVEGTHAAPPQKPPFAKKGTGKLIRVPGTPKPKSLPELAGESVRLKTTPGHITETAEEKLARRATPPTLREQRSIMPTGSSKSIETFVADTLKPLLKKDPHTLVETPPTHPPTTPATAPVPAQPITLSSPAATQTVQQTVKDAKSIWDKWPVDRKLITTVPQTPVISLNERFHVGLNNDLHQLVESPAFKAVVKITPEERLTQAVAIEEQALTRYRSLVQGGMNSKDATATAIAEIPEPWRAFFQVGREKEQTARAMLGLPPLREVEGPYFAHVTAEDSKELFTILGQEGSVGNHLHTTAGAFEKTRAFPTMAEGLRHGIAYDDPLKAIVLRQWAGAQIVRTAEFMESLLKSGVLTPLTAGVTPTSPHRFVLQGLPSSPAFAVSTREEALFLKQNFSAKGKLGAYYHVLNQAFRNPNLWNPLPHIVKNMGAKYWMAGANPLRLAADAKEYRAGTDPLVPRFKAVMPFTTHGKTEYDLMGPYVHPSKWNALLKGVGMANAISSKIVFATADPVMRYSLWKNYLTKGFSDQAAANHVWVDLIRYSMRSELVDTWKSIPFNFFVPWRTGSVISISKNLRMQPMRTGATLAASPLLYAVTRPIRTALVLGILDLAREHYYRQTGETFHMPADYVEGPVTKLIDDPTSAPYLAATMLIFGPGGEHVARQLKQMLELMQGSGDMDVVKRMFWGLAQGSTMADHLVQFERDGNVDHLVKLLAESATGMYQTSGYEPHRLSKYIPEDVLPKDALVTLAEQYKASRKAQSLRKKEGAAIRKESREEALKALSGGN